MKSLQELFELQAAFSGSMIALRVPPDAWYKLRSTVREPLEDPHVTIVYMPDLTLEEVPAVREAVREAVKDQDSFKIKVDKISTFPGAENDGKVPHIALLEKPAITKLRNKIVAELDKIRPDLVDKKFPTYKPHTTLQWVTEDVPFPELKEEVSWDVNEVRLYFKSARRERFPFQQVIVPDLAEEAVKVAVELILVGEVGESFRILAGKGKRIWNCQKCKYCDEPARKAILHSNAYSFVPVCNAHVKKCKSEIDEYCGQRRIPRKEEKCDFCEVPATFVTFQKNKVAFNCKSCMDKAKREVGKGQKYGEPISKRLQ